MKLKEDDTNNLNELLQGSLTDIERHKLLTSIQGQALVLRGNKRFNMKIERVLS